MGGRGPCGSSVSFADQRNVSSGSLFLCLHVSSSYKEPDVEISMSYSLVVLVAATAVFPISSQILLLSSQS